MKLRSLVKIFVVKDSMLYQIEDKFIDIYDDIDRQNKEYIKGLKIKNIDLKQCYTFVKKEKISVDITIMYVDIVNYKDIKDEYTLNRLDDSIYTKKAMEYLKNILGKYSMLKKLYSDEFTIPEVQKLFQFIYNTEYDRRNFRKKLLSSKCVFELDKYGKYCKGRPAKMYKFESKKDRVVL